MKKIILATCITVFLGGIPLCISAQAPFTTYKSIRNVLENGIYDATIYYSSSTGQKSKYTLNVKVVDDRVTAIYFGNNGSVHVGYNNEGYSYSGGTLSFSKSYNGEITRATTLVQIKYSNGTIQQFKIEL